MWFRGSTRDHAHGLGLRGWARNLEDGRVEVMAHGPVDAVDSLVEWLHSGPRLAQVDAVEVEVLDDGRETVPAAFDIR